MYLQDDTSLRRYYLLYRLSHFNLRKINEVDVSMTDTVLAEQLFSDLGNVTLQHFDLTQILGLLPDVRRKQVCLFVERDVMLCGVTLC